MRILLIALGNSLRGDDGIAHAAIRLLKSRTNVTSRDFLQLTPEVAAELAGFDLAVFVDADVHATEVRIEPLGSIPSRPSLTHWGDPIAIVNIARALFDFTGQALICRIPAADFSAAASSAQTAAEAASLLENLLETSNETVAFGRRRQTAGLHSSEPADAIACDEVINDIANSGRDDPEHGGHRKRESQQAEHSQNRGGPNQNPAIFY